jgi:hypothetical protein
LRRKGGRQLLGDLIAHRHGALRAQISTHGQLRVITMPLVTPRMLAANRALTP